MFPILCFSEMMNSETLIAPPKSSSSSWLHRLRSARGFPDSDHIDLDHFLTTLSIDPQTSTPQPTHNSITPKHTDIQTVQHHDSINNILSELFHMGEFQQKSRLNTKKSSRKQHSPRICLVPTPARNVASVSGQFNVSLNGRSKVKEVKVAEEDDDEEEKCDWDVTGYSQTEVTVIDTSVASWKFEKVLYRRKNIWKVGNKKGKGVMSGDRKKRKEFVSENGDVHKKKLKIKSRDEEEVVGEKKKKKKKKKKKLKLCNSLKYVDKEDDTVQGHEQDKTKVAAYKKKQDNCSQVQEKSFLKKQIDGGSSVVLIKSIPITNKKDVSGISKSCVKCMQK